MKLAYSSNAYLNYSIEETIGRIAGLGYQGLELLADVPHAWPAGLLDERKTAIRQCLYQHRLAVSNVNGFMMNAVADPRQPYWHPSWIEPDPHYRAIRREHTKRAIRLAKDLGAASIQTEPGGPLETGQSWQSAADVFYSEIMPCIELAEQLEVFLLIEPEPGLMIETFEQYLEFAGRIGSPWVGLNFDIGHAYCVGQDPQLWIARMAPHTKHYHLEDIASTRRHAHLVPGRGAIDFPAVLREIDRSGYQGWITVELYPYIDDPDAAGREAKSFLERISPLSHLERGRG
jgi:sugar phosphate isomerase/epimerase